MPREVVISVFVPLLIVVLCIPLILQKIPRNRLYGFRTCYTLSSDEVWYRANKTGGVALTIAGAAWLLAGLILPRVVDSQERAFRLTGVAGGACVLVACLVAFRLTYRK